MLLFVYIPDQRLNLLGSFIIIIIIIIIITIIYSFI